MNNFSKSSKVKDIFKKPKGFELKEAIVFTYSLESSFLYDAFLPFLCNNNTGEWIRDRSNHLKVFINSSSLSGELPLNLLGNINQIKTAENSSFHPKIYFFKYRKDKKVFCQMVLGSFNLTADGFNQNNEFYASLSGGKKNKSGQKQKQSLIKFVELALNAALALAPSERRENLARIKSIIEFLDWPDGVEFYFTAPKYSGKEMGFSGNKCIMVSPFWDAAAINRLSKNAKQVSLYYNYLSEADAAPFEPKKIEGSNKFSCFQLNEKKLDKKKLHGKLYYFGDEKFGNIYLGSANCTSRAVIRGKNYEAGLVFKANYQHLKNWLDDKFKKVEFPQNYYQDKLAEDKNKKDYDNVYNMLEAGFFVQNSKMAVVIKIEKPEMLKKYKLTCHDRPIDDSPFQIPIGETKNLPGSIEVLISETSYQLPISGTYEQERGPIKYLDYEGWYNFKKNYISLKCNSPEDLLDLYLDNIAIDDFFEFGGEMMFNSNWRERKFPYKKLMELLYGSPVLAKINLSSRCLNFIEGLAARDDFGERKRGVFFADFENYDNEKEYRDAFFVYWKKYLNENKKSLDRESRIKVKKLLVKIEALRK